MADGRHDEANVLKDAVGETATLFHLHLGIPAGK
jgi:hypothetical protein